MFYQLLLWSCNNEFMFIIYFCESKWMFIQCQELINSVSNNRAVNSFNEAIIKLKKSSEWLNVFCAYCLPIKNKTILLRVHGTVVKWKMIHIITCSFTVDAISTYFFLIKCHRNASNRRDSAEYFQMRLLSNPVNISVTSLKKTFKLSSNPSWNNLTSSGTFLPIFH